MRTTHKVQRGEALKQADYSSESAISEDLALSLYLIERNELFFRGRDQKFKILPYRMNCYDPVGATAHAVTYEDGFKARVFPYQTAEGFSYTAQVKKVLSDGSGQQGYVKADYLDIERIDAAHREMALAIKSDGILEALRAEKEARRQAHRDRLVRPAVFIRNILRA